MLHILPRFGWLVHPTKCTGVSEALSSFSALGTSEPRHADLPCAPGHDRVNYRQSVCYSNWPLSVLVVAITALKGLICLSWVATGIATRLRTRAMDAVITLRPAPRSRIRTAIRCSWRAKVELSPASLDEIHWWISNIRRISGQPISPRPLDGLSDGDIFSDTSNLGVNAYIAVTGPDAAASSLVAALLAITLPCMSARTVLRRAERGIEFAAPLPDELLDASSTLCELFEVVLFIRAVRSLLGRGRH
jgi:hypothetical protein